MGNAHDKNEHGIVDDAVDDHVVLARVNAIEILCAFKLLRYSATRILCEDIEPPRNSLLDSLRQAFQLLRCSRSEFDAVPRALVLQTELLPQIGERNRRRAAAPKLVQRPLSVFAPVRIF